jgi:hypothetical protein
MPSSGMLRRIALVRTGISEEYSASIIKVIRLGELLAVTSNRSMLRWKRYVLPKRLVFTGATRRIILEDGILQ